MQKKEFNLLDESWIRVVTPSLEPKEVSLVDALVHAHEYQYLSGEMPTQDAAIFRLLLAAALTIFYRYRADGESSRLSESMIEEEAGDDEDADDWEEEEIALIRWQRYWRAGRFPEEAVREYLESFRERFWLFHPETPFWQVNDLQYGTDYGSECLFGNIKESNNAKTRHHFSMTDGEELKRLSYGEAARWLVHLNAYAVNVKTDKKAPGEGLPVGVGRLGQLGYVMVNGDNLFQMLMLNLCAQKADGELWEEPKPIWEQAVRTGQGCKISAFDNLPERYTIQSRRIMLKREEGSVTGYRAIGGDFTSLEDDFDEPMTIWKGKKADKKTDIQHFMPQTHNPAIHVWREFPALLDSARSTNTGEKHPEHNPGVVQWMQALHMHQLLPPDFLLTFRMIGMVYGDQMSYTYGDCVNDSLTISAELLSDLDKVWISHICDQVEKCQKVASEALNHAAYRFCKLLYGNGSAKSGIKDALIRKYYFSIDGPFREWLMNIDPKTDSGEEKQDEWERQSSNYARKAVEDYVITLGSDLYIYREDEAKSGKKSLLTIPGIMNGFSWELGKIYKKIENK